MPVFIHFVLILLLGFGYRATMATLLTQGDLLGGFQLPALAFSELAIILISAAFLSVLIPKRFKRPSDVFLFVYAVIVIIPKIFLVGIFQTLQPIDVVSISFLIFLPAVLVWVVSRVTIMPSPERTDLHLQQVALFLVLVVSFGCFSYIYFRFRDVISLDFSSHYDRRFMFRELVGSSFLFGYFFNFFAMALTPFMAFFAVQQKSITLWLLSMLSVGLVFSVSGEKFPILLVLVATGLGIFLSSKKNLSTSTLLFLMTGVNVLTLAEVFMFGSAVWGDLVFRRFVIVPSHVTEIYYHYFANNEGFTLLGSGNERMTFLMGQLYFSNPELNLNANFVFVEIAISGLLGLGGAIMFLIIWLKFIDEAYRLTGDRNFYLLALLIGAISFEQRIFPVFLSSGIGFLTVFVAAKALLRPVSFRSLNLSRSI